MQVHEAKGARVKKTVRLVRLVRIRRNRFTFQALVTRFRMMREFHSQFANSARGILSAPSTGGMAVNRFTVHADSSIQGFRGEKGKSRKAAAVRQ